MSKLKEVNIARFYAELRLDVLDVDEESKELMRREIYAAYVSGWYAGREALRMEEL